MKGVLTLFLTSPRTALPSTHLYLHWFQTLPFYDSIRKHSADSFSNLPKNEFTKDRLATGSFTAIKTLLQANGASTMVT